VRSRSLRTLPRIALLGLAFTAGCARHRPMVAPLPACAPAPASTAGWETQSGVLFTFLVPPGLRYARVTGIDSGIDTYTGRGIRISHEEGPYAGPSLGGSNDARNDSECTTAIGGAQAHVATWNTPRGGLVLHAAWRRVAPAGPMGDTNLAISIHMRASDPMGVTKLAIYILLRASDPHSQAVAHAILHSVRFRSPAP
jgi:hypothetical protein